jgi:prevent-host-death family protein
MAEMSLTEARSRLADVIDEARVAHDPVFLTRRGRQVAAVIDADDLRQLMEAAEDLADIRAAQAARAEMTSGDDTRVSLAELKAELGMA